MQSNTPQAATSLPPGAIVVMGIPVVDEASARLMKNLVFSIWASYVSAFLILCYMIVVPLAGFRGAKQGDVNGLSCFTASNCVCSFYCLMMAFFVGSYYFDPVDSKSGERWSALDVTISMIFYGLCSALLGMAARTSHIFLKTLKEGRPVYAIPPAGLANLTPAGPQGTVIGSTSLPTGTNANHPVMSFDDNGNFNPYSHGFGFSGTDGLGMGFEDGEVDEIKLAKERAHAEFEAKQRLEQGKGADRPGSNTATSKDLLFASTGFRLGDVTPPSAAGKQQPASALTPKTEVFRMDDDDDESVAPSTARKPDEDEEESYYGTSRQPDGPSLLESPSEKQDKIYKFD